MRTNKCQSPGGGHQEPLFAGDLRDAPEEARLTALFCALASIPSPSGSEGACADAVAGELAALGLDVVRDDAGAKLGSDGDNLYCRIAPAADGVPLFFCAHLDTVPPSAQLDPVVVDSVLRNSTPSIVGADNKAAVTVILETVRTLVTESRSHAGVELIFTIGEERGLRGARSFDSSRVRARSGFVLDHPGAIGGYVAAAPSRFIIRAAVHGRAAHAGIAPADGINAIMALAHALAALPTPPPDVTLNVGQVRGGSAINVVADRADASLEVRSLAHDAGAHVVDQVRRAFEEAADNAGCTLDIDVETAYCAFRVAPDSVAVKLASAAFAAVGRDAVALETRGGSDANVFCARGLDCVNLAHAVVDFHGPDEHVAVSDLVLMRHVLLEIVAAALSAAPGA